MAPVRISDRALFLFISFSASNSGYVTWLAYGRQDFMRSVHFDLAYVHVSGQD
jgi:hypothetical protein